MNREEIVAMISSKLGGQGNQVDLGNALPSIFGGLLAEIDAQAQTIESQSQTIESQSQTIEAQAQAITDLQATIDEIATKVPVRIVLSEATIAAEDEGDVTSGEKALMFNAASNGTPIILVDKNGVTANIIRVRIDGSSKGYFTFYDDRMREVVAWYLER